MRELCKRQRCERERAGTAQVQPSPERGMEQHVEHFLEGLVAARIHVGPVESIHERGQRDRHDAATVPEDAAYGWWVQHTSARIAGWSLHQARVLWLDTQGEGGQAIGH